MIGDANAEQYDAWNGESGQRSSADPDRRDRRFAPFAPAQAAAQLAETGPGRAVLDTVPQEDRPTAIAAVEAVLAEHLRPDGVALGAAVWVTTARRDG